jgi:tetratricopeptide (TPR) repeat protein
VALIVASLSLGLYAATRQRAIAERRFMQVRQLANRVLALDSEIRQLPGATKARHEIVAMAKDYLQALRPDAQANPDLALEIGVAYSQLAQAQGVPTSPNLGQYAQAEDSLRAADALLDFVLTGSPRHRTALLESARVAHARMILADSDQRRDDVLVHAHKSAGRLDVLLGMGNVTELEAHGAARLFGNIALAHKNKQLLPDAIAYARRAMAIAPPVRRADEIHAQGWSLIADSMRLSGDLEGALHAIREARRRIDGMEAINFGTESARRSTTFNVLWREGVILGEEGRISLGRPAEAIEVLQKAFDLIEAWAQEDADNASSRMLFASAGRELGNILRQRDPPRALAIYNQALLRLGEVKENARARRGEVNLLVGSAYPLRRLGRSAEAQKRLDDAFARLRQLKSYPADRVDLGSETDAALRALADHQADTGNPARALETYRQLLDGVLAAEATPEKNLSDTADLSRLYASMAVLHRRVGQDDLASEVDGRRLRLWQLWDLKLPKNPFVTAQLAAARFE